MHTFTICFCVFAVVYVIFIENGSCQQTNAGEAVANENAVTGGVPGWMKTAQTFMNRIVSRFQDPANTTLSLVPKEDRIRNMVTRLDIFGNNAAKDVRTFQDKAGDVFSGARNSTSKWMDRAKSWFNGR